MSLEFIAVLILIPLDLDLEDRNQLLAIQPLLWTTLGRSMKSIPCKSKRMVIEL